MDCRETRTLLNAFHDGELPAGDRARVEEHLRGCPECGALLGGLARADWAAGVPDPGPAYWDRFNARVMDRVAREADGQGWPSAGTGRDATGSLVPADGQGWPSAGTGRDATGSLVPADGQGVRVLRPKGGWMREQFRYLVPAAAAAALVLVIVHYGEMRPGAPTPTARDGQVPGQAGMPRGLESRPTAPPAVSKPEASRKRATSSAPLAVPSPAPLMPLRGAPDGQGWPSAGTGRDATGSGVPADGQGWPGAEAGGDANGFVGPAAGPPPVTATDETPMRVQAERKKMSEAADGHGWPSAEAGRDAPGVKASADRMAEQQSTGKGSSASGTRMEKDQSVEAPPSMPLRKTRLEAGAPSLAPASSRVASPCELARTLAEQGRIRDADAAQRTCLAGDLDAPSREKGLVFLAELLDRQGRFPDADAVIAEVEKQYPQSRPLDLYLQQRPMVQKRPKAVPVTR